MKYFWTLFWGFLLIQMVNYVGGSMLGVSYDFKTAAILGVAAAIILFLIPAVLPKHTTEEK